MIKKEEVPVIKDIHYCDRCGLKIGEFGKDNVKMEYWMFGHGETKATCLWLKGLPKLVPTNIVEGREARIHKMPPSENRWKERSRTYEGIAEAMANQWGCILK